MEPLRRIDTAQLAQLTCTSTPALPAVKRKSPTIRHTNSPRHVTTSFPAPSQLGIYVLNHPPSTTHPCSPAPSITTPPPARFPNPYRPSHKTIKITTPHSISNKKTSLRWCNSSIPACLVGDPVCKSWPGRFNSFFAFHSSFRILFDLASQYVLRVRLRSCRVVVVLVVQDTLLLLVQSE
jgi:hypothetical protein